MRVEPWKEQDRRMPRRAIGRLFLVVGTAALVGGCGNLTAGGATGETTVYVVANGEDAGAVPSAAPVGSAREESVAGTSWLASSSIGTAPVGVAGADDDSDDGGDSDDEPEGEMEMHFFLSLVRPDGTPEPLTDDEAQIKIDLPGRQEVEVLTRRIPAGRYDRFRVTFTDIEVEIDAGLIIGGVEVTGPVDVDLEETTLVVERPIDLNLEELDRAAVVVDMNASDWLAAVDPDVQKVAGSVVADLIEVVVR